MKIIRISVIVFTLLASAYPQGSPDFYIASLEMPCYPPLARQARVQGSVKIAIEVGKDGTVNSAQPIQGNRLLQTAAISNVRTWKFGSGEGHDLSTLKTTIDFEYKLEGEPGWLRCAARVSFDGLNKVEIVTNPAVVNWNSF
jgi:TonB family protein